MVDNYGASSRRGVDVGAHGGEPVAARATRCLLVTSVLSTKDQDKCISAP